MLPLREALVPGDFHSRATTLSGNLIRCITDHLPMKRIVQLRHQGGTCYQIPPWCLCIHLYLPMTGHRLVSTSGLNAIAFFQYCDFAEVSKIVRMCYSSSIGGSFFSFSFLSCSLPISEMLFSGVGKFSGIVPSFFVDSFTNSLSDLVMHATCRFQSLRLFTSEFCLGLGNAEQVCTEFFTAHILPLFLTL